MRKINMSGLRFGRLTVLCEDGRLNGEVSWKCKCDCGNIKIVRGSHLRKGSIMSCGCLLSDTLKERNTIHNMTNTKIYKIWMHLKGMCYTKTDFNYHKVGAAGILMDESWIDKQMGLLNFYSWAKSVGYEDGMEICRKDDSKNYCPENCYFKKNNYKKYEYPNIETKLFIEGEIWKDIPKFPDYQISNFGRLKSKERINAYGRTITEKIIKPCLNTEYGYFYESLASDGTRKNVLIHRLVAEAFIPNPNRFPIVNHKDENKLNNKVSNLEWCDYSYNFKYSFEKHKERYCRQVAKLDDNGNIIKVYKSIKEAGDENGLKNPYSISSCCRGRIKTSGGFRWIYYDPDRVATARKSLR